jgi:hypothetical protein
MTAWVYVIGAFVGAIFLSAAGSLASDEIKGRLELLPRAILWIAARWLDPAQRVTVYEEEWLPELIYIVRDSESLPITRLVLGVRYSIGIVIASQRVSRQLASIPQHPTPVTWAARAETAVNLVTGRIGAAPPLPINRSMWERVPGWSTNVPVMISDTRDLKARKRAAPTLQLPRRTRTEPQQPSSPQPFWPRSPRRPWTEPQQPSRPSPSPQPFWARSSTGTWADQPVPAREKLPLSTPCLRAGCRVCQSLTTLGINWQQLALFPASPDLFTLPDFSSVPVPEHSDSPDWQQLALFATPE